MDLRIRDRDKDDRFKKWDEYSTGLVGSSSTNIVDRSHVRSISGNAASSIVNPTHRGVSLNAPQRIVYADHRDGRSSNLYSDSSDRWSQRGDR